MKLKSVVDGPILHSKSVVEGPILHCKEKYVFLVKYDDKIIKDCLSLFSYFIDMSPMLMSPFFVEKTCFFDNVGLMSMK